MICPWCGEPMERGYFYSRGCNHYLPEGKRPKVLLYTEKSIASRNGVKLPPDPWDLSLSTDDWPVTYHCRACRKLVLPY